MKKLSIAVILLLLISIVTSCSQNSVPFTSRQETPLLPKAEEVIEPVSKNEVNPKLIKSFYKSYGDQQSSTWYRSSKGFSVSFDHDGIKTFVRYTNAGLEESRLISYFEKNLSPEIRHTVKSNFYDYTILHITEVQKNDVTIFYIKMQDRKNIKTIRMINGEWDVIETLEKI